MSKKKTSRAVDILQHRYYQNQRARQADLESERQNAAIARKLFELRSKAGLTQSELATRVGTSASVISRMESADYDGHSLNMLRRIATALGKSIEIRFIQGHSA
jgi:DNA-binding XRE family transcriptional regulator